VFLIYEALFGFSQGLPILAANVKAAQHGAIASFLVAMLGPKTWRTAIHMRVIEAISRNLALLIALDNANPTNIYK